MIWQTRTVSTFVAAAAPISVPGGGNPLYDAAREIGLTPADKAEKSTVEPRDGTFERFMSSFGAPGRWAGSG